MRRLKVKRTFTAGRIVDNHPPDEEDGRVVIHVQERDLAVRAAQRHDDRVAEFENLGQVENVENARHAETLGRRVDTVAKDWRGSEMSNERETTKCRSNVETRIAHFSCL